MKRRLIIVLTILFVVVIAIVAILFLPEINKSTDNAEASVINALNQVPITDSYKLDTPTFQKISFESDLTRKNEVRSGDIEAVLDYMNDAFNSATAFQWVLTSESVVDETRYLFLQQQYNGQDIFGAQASVEIYSGSVKSVNASGYKNLNPDSPTLSADNFAQSNPGADTSNIWYAQAYSTSLVPAVDVTDGVTRKIFSLVDGELLLESDYIRSNRLRSFSVCNGQECEPVSQSGNSIIPANQISVVEDSVNRMLAYYRDILGINSYDNRGTEVAVEWAPNNAKNGFWQHDQSKLVISGRYENAIELDDLVGHELSHGVVQGVLPNIVYQNQSGAIDEAMSDIFGDTLDRDWQEYGLRNHSNPVVTGQPDKLSSSLYHCDNSDRGGVHKNGSIVSHFAYLASEGFSDNEPAGRDSVNKVLFNSLNYLNDYPNFRDLYDGLIRSCATLMLSGELTVNQCATIKQAAIKVELNQQLPAFNKAPQCADQSSPFYNSDLVSRARGDDSFGPNYEPRYCFSEIPQSADGTYNSADKIDYCFTSFARCDGDQRRREEGFLDSQWIKSCGDIAIAPAICQENSQSCFDVRLSPIDGTVIGRPTPYAVCTLTPDNCSNVAPRERDYQAALGWQAETIGCTLPASRNLCEVVDSGPGTPVPEPESPEGGDWCYQRTETEPGAEQESVCLATEEACITAGTIDRDSEDYTVVRDPVTNEVVCTNQGDSTPPTVDAYCFNPANLSGTTGLICLDNQSTCSAVSEICDTIGGCSIASDTLGCGATPLPGGDNLTIAEAQRQISEIIPALTSSLTESQLGSVRQASADSNPPVVTPPPNPIPLPPGCTTNDCDGDGIPNDTDVCPADPDVNCTDPNASTAPLPGANKDINCDIDDPTNTEYCLQNPIEADNIFDIIATIVLGATRILIPLSILMIIYGGLQFVIAAGSEDKIKNAKKTFTNIIIGVTIIVGANVVIEILRQVLTSL